MSIKKKPTTITMPIELIQAIDKDAKHSHWSRSNTIVVRLAEVYKLTGNVQEENHEGDQHADEK